MVQQVLNFVKTTLRAPVGISDTQLQLAAGAGSLFDPITAGNWCFITVNDSTSAEVMKYTSSGLVVNDTITVTRAQDGTTAKAFPVGACVSVGWNTEQVVDLITQTVGEQAFTDTVCSATSPTGPTGAPDPGVIYAIDPNTGLLWFWQTCQDTPSWVLVNSNSVQLSTSAPTAAPPGNVVWNINTTTSSLYYWDGVGPWRLVSGGGGGSNYLEILSIQYKNDTGVLIPKNTDFNISEKIADATITVTNQCVYKSNPAVTTVISMTTDKLFKVNAPCIVQLEANFVGDVEDVAKNTSTRVGIFNNATPTDTFQWTQRLVRLANSAGNSGYMGQVSSGPYQVAADHEFFMEIATDNGDTTFAGFTLKQLQFKISVIALL